MRRGANVPHSPTEGDDGGAMSWAGLGFRAEIIPTNKPSQPA